MSRRVIGVVAVVLALVGGRLLVNRGMRSVDASRARATAGAAAASPTPVSSPQDASAEPRGEAPGAVLSEPSTNTAGADVNGGTPIAVAPAQDGVTDVDPHKAFGSKNAPVVMEIFSDYQCPACKALYESTNRQLMDNYVSTGKVYLIHRDFPLQMHAYSRVAARYARAAAEIGKVEQAEKALFDNQEKWEQTGDVDGILAGVLTTSEMTKVRALVKGGTMDALVDKDYQLGMGYRVNQTPTTVFHSKGQTYPYSGGMSYDILRQFLDQLLSQK